MKLTCRGLLLASVLLTGASLVTESSAHISLEKAGTQKSRDGDANLKAGPCGTKGSTRGTNIYTYAAGETVSVSVIETIPHPSYFRIAFDEDGDDAFKEPAWIQPIDPARACPFNAADQCGKSDFYNDPSVLPNMDNLDPHLTASFGQKYTWEVTMPDVACDNCTLQIIQVMQDTVHGAYNPTQGDPADVPYVADIYHQCIDLVLTRAGDAGAGTSGGKPAAAAASSNGCAVGQFRTRSVADSSAALLGLFALALCGRRRRSLRS